jgi:uncharacterized membrane protein
MSKEKILKIICAILIVAQCGFMAFLLTKLYIFLYPTMSWQAVLGYIILFDLALSNAILIFSKK